MARKSQLALLERYSRIRSDALQSGEASFTKKPAATRAGPAKSRLDDWANVVTGFGVLGMDKRLGGAWGYTQIDQLTCQDMWRGDPWLNRIVTVSPNEELREGFQIGIQGEKDLAQEMDDLMKEIRRDPGSAMSEDKILTARYWARAYGGCGMILGADDGAKDLSLPLQEDRIRTFDWMTPFTPMELVPVTYYSDPLKPRFGEIATYRLTPLERPPGDAPDLATLPVIHESRILRFDGEITSRGQMLYNVHPGWGDSVFIRIQQAIADFEAMWSGISILLADFAVPTLKIKELARLLSAQDATAQTIQVRAQAIENARSICNTVIIDTEEEYKRETTSVAGLSDLVDKMILQIAGICEMPVSFLMGQAPAGLNATGDSDIRWFYDQIRAKQERLYYLLMKAKTSPGKGQEPDNWCVNFKPLWQMTEKDIAALRFQQAQADQIYIANQVVTPEEIAQSRFGGDAYSLDTVVDIGLRNEVMNLGHQAARLGTRPEDIFPPTAPPVPAIDMSKQGPDQPGAFDPMKVPPAKLNPALAAAGVAAAKGPPMPSPLPKGQKKGRTSMTQANPPGKNEIRSGLPQSELNVLGKPDEGTPQYQEEARKRFNESALDAEKQHAKARAKEPYEVPDTANHEKDED
jgi:phage-related protein (TIGR01555 family)